ncbi:MAG TPA: hypothetical protein VGE98_11535 [Thermoanaerobaculia bacterium]
MQSTYRRGILPLLSILAFATHAAFADDIPTHLVKAGLPDTALTFPNTAVGQTSTFQCIGFCFRQPSSPAGACDGTGTVNLTHDVSAPFSAGTYRVGPASACGGTAVTLPVTLHANQALWFDVSFAPTQTGTFSDVLTLANLNYDLSGSTGSATTCVANATTLCLQGGRFAVSTTWRTPDGQTGNGQAVSLTSDTGFFWFFQSTNVEMVIKVLNGCGLNQRYWVFAGGLTNVMVATTVVDTATGTMRVYHNPQGTPFQPLQDTSAFASCSN